MKKLIRKILKEADDFEWAKGMDLEKTAAEHIAPWKRINDNYDFDAVKIYEMLTNNGFYNLDVLDEIADHVWNETETLFDNGRQAGYDDCSCDGCCDDYVWYEDHRNAVDEAREEGSNEGYDRGKEDAESEYEDQISELNEKIAELESEIERLQERGEE